ncbi:hypothetical protein D3Y57_11515 [Sphingomonas paeninsulae]|uniref:Nickel/cobalt transporter regulator n=1 Tax=Sphingomonas paeninsulae TaxID=2319844 RepID=A0A494TKI5_SPHPE|nr:hypothetical protein D3Y57_11515 [Sphingomonas paeninsulae]
MIAALLAAAAATPALAQDDRGRGGNDSQAQRGGGDRGAHRGGEGRPQAAQAPHQQQAAPQQGQRPQAVQGQRPGGQPNWQGRGRPGMVQGQQVQGQGHVQGQQQRPQGQWNGQRPAPAQVQQQRGDGVRNWQGNRGGNDPRFGNNNRNGGRDGNWRGNNGGGGQSWNRDWRRDQRYNWQSYRSGHRNFYRLPRYQSPYGYGYGYQRFGIGVYLDSVLFSQNYWIDDPYEYRLPEAYPPYHWVRYYNDALLVDEDTGYVVDTIYDIFD